MPSLDRFQYPSPFEVVQLDDEGWARLHREYSQESANPRPLHRCLEVARAGNAVTAVVEGRYVDRDYRSEYMAHQAERFESLGAVTRRIHFFASPLEVDQVWRLPEDAQYLGYIVIRPTQFGTVGRTLLAPPPELLHAVRTSVKERVYFFGQLLYVYAVPFMEQDAQVDRCAHTAVWVCHYSAWVRHLVARRNMADFSLLANHSLQSGRPLPSPGLTVGQLTDVMRRFGLSPFIHEVSELVDPTTPEGWKPNKKRSSDQARANRITSICCRYLNSALPIIVTTQTHAFVLCGYWNERAEAKGTTRTRLVRHDDQRGPYIVVDDVLSDVDEATGYGYGPWDDIVVPLPAELWVTGESVERTAAEMLRPLAEHLVGDHPTVVAVLNAIEDRTLALRTYAQSSNHFKHRLAVRSADLSVLREFRVARLSRFVWVVELVDREKWEAGEKSVLGEIVFDGTSTSWFPRPLAVHLPGHSDSHERRRYEGLSGGFRAVLEWRQRRLPRPGPTGSHQCLRASTRTLVTPTSLR